MIHSGAIFAPEQDLVPGADPSSLESRGEVAGRLADLGVAVVADPVAVVVHEELGVGP